MKRTMFFLVGVGFILTNLTSAQAGFWGKKKTESKDSTVSPGKSVEAVKPASEKASEPAKPVPVSPTDKERDEALKAKRAIAQKKLNELNNTEWGIELLPMSVKGKKEVDTVTFKNNQVGIAGFAKKGFSFTNFTLTVQEDGVVIWETMQTSEKSGIAFWRGELDPKLQTMRGVVSHQIDQKNKQDYSFTSDAKKNIPAPGK